MNNNCEKEWKKILNKGVGKVDAGNEDSDDIQIVVVDAPPKNQDALSFWMNRIKNKTKNNCINIDDPSPLPSPSPTPNALHSAKLLTAHTKSALPIVTHQKQRQRNGAEVINVEQASAKMNVQKYKNSLFRTEQKSKQQYVQSQQSKKRRYQRQIQIIQNMNTPRWMQEKDKRQELNRTKYPVSSVANSGYERNLYSKGVDTYNEATWANYQRTQQLIRQKNREKQQEQKRKERQRQKELKLQKKKNDQKHYQEFASGLFGQKKQKIDDSLPLQVPTGEANETQKAVQPVQAAQIEKTEVAAIQLQHQSIKKSVQVQEGEIEVAQPTEYGRRRIRIGAKDIVNVTSQSPYSSQIIRAVLAHNYSLDLPIVEVKKIPDIFQDQVAYKRIFHFLIANQSKAEVSQRMRQIEKDGQGNPIKVKITKVKENTEGQTQIYMKETDITPQGKKPIALKGFSLSRLRIGLLTNQVEYKRQNYGISSDYEAFGILVVLVTPESKEELGEEVKALGKVRPHELDMVFMRMGSQAYFYDMEKLSTHYRQYLAVSNLIHSELAPVVLNPQLMERSMRELNSNRDCISVILEYLHSIFNQTQWESICQMVQIEKGIVLLQGPPGTGKTSTLMGLLSAQYQYLKRTGDNRKIMICAPSNAAVDHIVKRLQVEGLIDGQSETIHPNVLRVGIVETLDETVRAVSLDHLCEKKVIEFQEKTNAERKLTTIEIKDKIVSLQKEMRQANKPGHQKDYNALKIEEQRYNDMLYQFRQAKTVTHRQQFTYFQNQYIHSAQIILTTLSSSGNEKLDRLKGEIACLIIDEAAQATQPNLLIALQTGVQKVLLIGDPYQLPATCMSSDCNVTLFNRSLFQRFLDANIKPYFLNIQYRMAPLIRHFPSKRFYHNRLIDAASIAQRQKPPILDCFGSRSVVFVDVKYGKEELRGNSQLNEAEGKVVGMLVRCLMQEESTMGIITPYQAQRKIIARECKHELMQINSDPLLFEKNVMVNTVDSFQGQERDIIIVSTVRANNHCNMGFLTDQRRINVTLTRSKFQLIIVGNGDTLGSNQVWNQFLEWAEQEKVYYQLNSPTELKDVLKTVFQHYNTKPIRRRKYGQLSSDIRHQNRQQMQFSGIKVKKAHEKISSKLSSSSSQDKKSNNNEKQEKPTIKSDPQPPIVEDNPPIVSKYALNATQIEKIRQQKRQKDKQAKDFQAMNDRMRIKEQEILQSSTYSYLNF